MISVLLSLLLTLRGSARSRAALQLEVLALRHQLQVLHRARSPRLRLTAADPLLWVWLARVWNNWRTALVIVKPETVIAWHRRGFRLFWTWKSRRRTGRPTVPSDVRALIRTMSRANPLWGAPRIHGELLKLGIDVCQATVAKYMVRPRRPPSQTWRTFLANHIGQMMAADFFVVPTAAVAVKFELAYLRSLDVDDVPVALANTVYTKYVSGDVPSPEDYKRLQDFLFRHVAHECGMLGLAVHTHVSSGSGTYFANRIASTDAVPLTPQISWEDTGWLAVTTARQALSGALDSMITDGEITRERAIQLARLALRDNAARLYDFEHRN
jgi:hypothetical protein